MKVQQCLYCYQSIPQDELETSASQAGFHLTCSKKFFGKIVPPELPYSDNDMLKLAEKIVKSHKTVTGVQPKLSLGIRRGQTHERFTIVGLLGEYILKPPTKIFPSLPEVEDLTMHLAQASKIKTVEHSLIYLKSGELAYITKRIDRHKGKKFHMEDMCQLTERLTEHKYKGSYEQIAKAILKYAAHPLLDVINFYEEVVFSFLTGNNDMHLKNFSLLKDKSKSYNLSPAYDLVASELLVEGDDEELALNLNGKKRKLSLRDFEKAMTGAGMDKKTIENIFDKFTKAIPNWHKLINISFMPAELKTAYHEMVEFKQKQIELK